MGGKLPHHILYDLGELYQSALLLCGSAVTVVTEQKQHQDRCHTIEQFVT